jgi:hypothetical protein
MWDKKSVPIKVSLVTEKIGIFSGSLHKEANGQET